MTAPFEKEFGKPFRWRFSMDIGLAMNIGLVDYSN
jgi:hypothetical protein